MSNDARSIRFASAADAGWHATDADACAKLIPLAQLRELLRASRTRTASRGGEYMTTRQAAAYCGFKTTGALRKAHMEGRIRLAGRRGGKGTWMWSRKDLDRFLRGEAPDMVPAERSGAPLHGGAHGKASGLEVVQEQLDITDAGAAGVWQRKEGGHVVRARVTESTTGRLKEIWKVLPDSDAPAALRWLSDEKARVAAGVVSVERQKKRFAEFAQSLFERKVQAREIRSAKGRQRWAHTLVHLIAGTEVIVRDQNDNEIGRKFVPGFGEFFLDKLLVSHVEEWKAGIATVIAAGHYAPTTCNGWLSILRVILQAARRELGLPHLATEGVKDFDVSEHDTYSEEEPNALLPQEVPLFLDGNRPARTVTRTA